MNPKLADKILIVQTILLGLACVFRNLAEPSFDSGDLRQILFAISAISGMILQSGGAPILWVLLLLCIIALAQYWGPERKRGLLRCLCAYGFLKAFFITALIVKNLLVGGMEGATARQAGLLLFIALWYMAWLFASMMALRYHAQREKQWLAAAAMPGEPADADPEALLDEADLAGQEGLLSATRDRRLGNYLVDLLLIVFVMVPYLGLLLNERRVYILDSRRDEGAFYLVTALAIFIYYSLFEGLFASSPGKFVTGTRLVHENGQPAGMLRVLGRSLCRLIPFDAFSFLGVRGWHDSISKTDVVELGNQH